MRISPTDIRQQQFEIKFRGFAAEEVTNYLALIARELEELNQENMELKEGAKKIQRELTDYKKNDYSFRKIIGAAQEFKEDVTNRASKEAELILRQAETKAREVVEAAKEKAFGLEKGLNDIKMQRKQFEISLRSMIDNHLKMLNSNK